MPLCFGANMSIFRRATMRSSCLSAAIAAALFLPVCALAQDNTETQPRPSARTLDTIEVRGATPETPIPLPSRAASSPATDVP